MEATKENGFEMFEGKRAPVQGDEMWEFRMRGDVRHEADNAAMPPGTIAWSEHLEAFRDYSSRYGSEQSAERLAERGGFGYQELLTHLKHHPETWQVRPWVIERYGQAAVDRIMETRVSIQEG